MKIAICLSGQPRFFEKGFENMKNKVLTLNQECSFDFFVHCWYNEKNIDKGYDCAS